MLLPFPFSLFGFFLSLPSCILLIPRLSPTPKSWNSYLCCARRNCKSNFFSRETHTGPRVSFYLYPSPLWPKDGRELFVQRGMSHVGLVDKDVMELPDNPSSSPTPPSGGFDIKGDFFARRLSKFFSSMLPLRFPPFSTAGISRCLPLK